MTYSVKLSPHAAKQYRKLPSDLAASLSGGFDALQHQPLAGPKIKRLKGRLRDYYRYRVGDYRIVYSVATAERIVYVDYIQHRKSVYREIP